MPLYIYADRRDCTGSLLVRSFSCISRNSLHDWQFGSEQYGEGELSCNCFVLASSIEVLLTRILLHPEHLLLYPISFLIEQLSYFRDQHHQSLRILLVSSLFAKYLPTFLGLVFHSVTLSGANLRLTLLGLRDFSAITFSSASSSSSGRSIFAICFTTSTGTCSKCVFGL